MAHYKEYQLFDETSELKGERLFSLIQNAVSCGEWELAQACAKLYHQQSKTDDDKLQKILQDIIKHPRKYSHGSSTVPTPFHLSWLALALYLDLYSTEMEKEPLLDATRCLIEFKLFLLNLSKDLTPEQQQDSFCFFKLGLEKHKQHEALIGLSNEFRSFISEFAISNPQGCRTLTEFLISPTTDETVIKERKTKIGDSYLRVLLSYIGRLQLFEESVQSMFLGECFPIVVSAKEHFSSDSVVFTNAVLSIVKIILQHNPDAMNLLYCSLIDKESIPILMVALELSWKFKLESLHLQDLLEETIYGEIEHNSHVAEILSEGFASNSRPSMLTSFQICDYYNIHFYDCILNASLEMIKNNRYTSALELLQPEPLQSLKPLVMLLAWPLCLSSRDKSALMTSFFSFENREFEQTLNGACKRLEYNLKIGKQCFKKQRDAKLKDGTHDENHEREETYLFQDMDFHSVLFVLNKLRYLEFFHLEEVTHILQEQPSCISLCQSFDVAKVKQSEIRTFMCFCVLKIMLECFVVEKQPENGSIDTIKSLIRRINPLIYRLETLEHIFSLLFVRNEHISTDKRIIEVDAIPGKEEVSTLNDEDHGRRTSGASKINGGHAASEFLFQQESVKMLLDQLNEWIVELIAEKYSEKETTSKSAADDASISSSDFDKRIAQLRQNVNHAIWRLELVAGFHSAESSLKFSEDGENSLHEIASLVSSDDLRSHEQPPQLLSQMLSSPESLTHLCLQKGSLLQAQQVIKVFQLEDHFCGLEVDFAKVFANCIESLKATQPVEISRKSTNLTNIKSAAAAGLLSSTVRTLVNDLLRHKCIDMNQKMHDHPLEEMQCFAAISICFDLVTSAELHSAVCKTILDISEELIKSVDDVHAELKSVLMAHLSALKSSVHVFGQLSSNQLKNELNDKTNSFSHFFTKPYRKPLGEGTEYAFQKMSEQKASLEEIVSFIDKGMNHDEVLVEDKKPDTTPCRKCMNETLAAYSSDNLVLIPDKKSRRNYIKTLFRHMDTLARLQLYFKTRHSGLQVVSKLDQKSSLSGVKALNPFVVLKDDISVIFGRLLFEWNMPPKRLESIAKQVNINLVKVVAKRFDLSIPVQKEQRYPDLATFLLTQPRIILNSGELSDQQIRHPVEVIEDLVSRLLAITKALPSTCETYVGSSQFRNLVLSKEFAEFKQNTTLLRTVDLSLLEHDGDKICFMINLYNVMFIHGILFILSGELDGMPNLVKEDFPKWTYESLMSSHVGRFGADQFLSYEVGQFGILSAFDLCRHILLGGTSTSYYGDAFKTKNDSFEWSQDRLTYAPSKHEKSCIFALTHASSSCPVFKLWKADNFTKRLNHAQKRYLEQHVTIVQNERKVIIPKLLHWHKDLFLARQPLSPGLQTASSLDFKNRSVLLMEFIKQSSSKLGEQLEKVSAEHVLLDIAEYNWKLSFHAESVISTKEPSRNGKENQAAKRSQKSYSLNEPIKKYLYDASPVPASIICMALEKKKFLNQISEMIIQSKYGGITMGKQRISSLHKFIEDGIKNLSQTVDANAPFKAFTALCCETILKILKSLQVDQPNAAAKYVENLQSLIKVTCSMLDVCGSINVESSEFLEELLNVFLQHGGILISAFIETFPDVCPLKSRDIFLCESIHGIRDRLDDLTERCAIAGENALKIDLDHITELTMELKHCLLLLSDPFLRCRVTLDSITFYDANEALEIVEVCAEGCTSSDELLSKLKLEAEKIRWYEDVRKLYTSRFPAVQPSERVKLIKWQDCIDFVHFHPEDITILLVASGSFDQVDFWINNFSVPHYLSKICLHAKLHDILKDDCLEYSKLHSFLDKLENKHVTFELCDEMLISSEISTRHSLLLLRYMTENLVEVVSPDKAVQLRNSELGFKALDQFPESLKSSYWHLTSKPELVLEQLLMNMKVELAKTVIDVYRVSVTEDSLLSNVLVRIDEILAVYAEKSLDVPVIEKTTPKISKTIDRRRSNKMHVRNSSYHNTSLVEHENLEQKDQSAHSPIFSDEKSSYRLPSAPIDSKDWTPDRSVTTCQVCNVQIFSTFNRRHHCRHCGRVCCASCSSFRCTVPGNPVKVRVCKECFETFYSGDSGKRDYDTDRPPLQDNIAHAEMPSSLPHVNTPCSTTDNELESEKKIADGESRGWQLTLDESANEEIRKHFCFDQAPSASLCIAIIEQCSDARKIGGLLLKFCNKLSEYLNERDSSKYHDIDNTLLVRMIEFLNFNAKVKFMKAGVVNGVELCDFEMAHVEVLRILLNSDWKELPTMQELAHPEVIRRLRDKIIESERFSLAIDVTGKCGLDPSAVWFAWGLSQLKSGDFKDARENFSKCLTPLKSVEDKALQQNVLYLTQIVEIIETSPLLAYAEGDLLSPLYVLQDLGRGSSTGCTLDVKRYDEIMYYLNKYGSHSQIVKFFVRQRLLRKAADYIRAQKCSSEIFFEDFLLRCFQTGSFDLLTHELEDMDPTLNKWKEHLVKSCQYLSKKGLFNCLYQLQIFLKDYFRAATTCVRFFLGESSNVAQSFKELHKRIYHLENAKKHLEMLLKEKAIVRSTFVSHIGSQRTDEPVGVALVQEVTVAELKSHLNTVELQIKVLNFFSAKSDIFEETTKKVPTLFGNGKERSDVVSKLLMGSISNSFPLVSRIIQDYRLPAVAVFGDCIMRLIQKKDYDQILYLIKTTEGTGMIPDKGRDKLLLKVIKRIIESGESAKQVTPFVKLLKSQPMKVEALIACGRLRDAYVEATKEDQVENVERILQEAERLNQKFVADICQRYLRNFEERRDGRGKLK